jgi:signal transduction histidine kinase
MRSLFAKIFGWFWLTVIVVGLAIAVSVRYSSDVLESRRIGMISTIFRTEAPKLAAAFAKDGKPGAKQLVTDLQKKYEVKAFFFRAEDLGVFGSSGLSPEIQKMAVFALREEGLHVAGPYASQRIIGPDGQAYALVLATSVSTSLLKSELLFFQVPLILLIAGGVFCLLITRHVTAPLVMLSAAAEGIAAGRLDTRVGKEFQKRRDEIAGLGRDFDHMAERIETLVTGQQDLLANISHELRSPLARLNVALGLLKREGCDPASENLARIALEAQRLDKLIGQLLMLSRLDSHAWMGAGAAIDLATLTQEVVRDADFEARSASRRVESDLVEPCIVSGNEELIRSAIENIVRNAVRHTRDGTSVDVSLRFVKPSQTILRVRDHGPGVPETMLAEIFRPFTRAVSNNETTGGGAGLGLAIAEKAVAAHGGNIRAWNATDGGLVVEIEIPARSITTAL